MTEGKALDNFTDKSCVICKVRRHCTIAERIYPLGDKIHDNILSGMTPKEQNNASQLEVYDYLGRIAAKQCPTFIQDFKLEKYYSASRGYSE